MQEVIVVLKDDMDNRKPAAGTFHFGYAGQWYEIDLNHRHASELERALQRFIESARPVAKVPPRNGSEPETPAVAPGSPKPADGDPAEIARKALNREIRAWAKSQSPPLQVSSAAGFVIPEATIAAFNAAHAERMTG